MTPIGYCGRLAKRSRDTGLSARLTVVAMLLGCLIAVLPPGVA